MGAALKLQNPPIVEAVLDIDCDVPPGQDLLALEEQARELLKGDYPKSDRQLLQEYRIEANADAAARSIASTPTVQALRFFHEDGKARAAGG